MDVIQCRGQQGRCVSFVFVSIFDELEAENVTKAYLMEWKRRKWEVKSFSLPFKTTKCVNIWEGSTLKLEYYE